jgi:hypothetical protein
MATFRPLEELALIYVARLHNAYTVTGQETVRLHPILWGILRR